MDPRSYAPKCSPAVGSIVSGLHGYSLNTRPLSSQVPSQTIINNAVMHYRHFNLRSWAFRHRSRRDVVCGNVGFKCNRVLSAFACHTVVLASSPGQRTGIRDVGQPKEQDPFPKRWPRPTPRDGTLWTLEPDAQRRGGLCAWALALLSMTQPPDKEELESCQTYSRIFVLVRHHRVASCVHRRLHNDTRTVFDQRA